MSSEESDKKSEEETKDISTSAEENEAKENETDQEKLNSKPAPKKKGAEPTKIKQPAKKRMKTDQVEKEPKKTDKKKAPKDDEEPEEEEEDEDNKAVPLLDQPLEVTGSRKRKEVQRFVPKDDAPEKKDAPLEVGVGKGVALGKMEVVKFGISRARPEVLRLLHMLCFNKPGKQATWKENIMKFNGWEYEEGSDDFEKKKIYARGIKKVLVAQLKEICTLLDIEKAGSRDDLLDKILSYLVCPVDSGKKLAPGRSKRKGALSKNYDEGRDKFEGKKRSKHSPTKKKSEDESAESEHEDELEKDEEQVKQNNNKKQNNTEESTEEEEKEEEEEEEEKETPKKKAPKKGKAAANKKAPPKKQGASKKATAADKKAAAAADKADSEGAAEDEESDQEEPEAEEAAETKEDKKKAPPKKRGAAKKATAADKKAEAVAKKAEAAAKKAEAAAKKAEAADKTDSDGAADGDNESEEEDEEPLSKKSKAPPTDEEIKSYVKSLLDGADLEQITMKKVCQDVYDHYPDFNLTSRKEFIKTTVKALISS